MNVAKKIFLNSVLIILSNIVVALHIDIQTKLILLNIIISFFIIALKINIKKVNFSGIFKFGDFLDRYNFSRYLYKYLFASKNEIRDDLCNTYFKIKTTLNKFPFVVIFSSNGKIIDINEAAIDIYGYTKEQMIDMKIDKLHYETKNNLVFHITKNGIPFPVNCTIADIMIGMDLITLYIINDISNEYNTTKSITELKEKYEKSYNFVNTIINAIPDMLWAKDINGIYLLVNNKLANILFGMTDIDFIIGKNENVLSSMVKKNKKHDINEVTLESDHIIVNSLTPNTFFESGYANGKWIDLEVHKTPLYDINNELIGIVGIGIDITEKIYQEKKINDTYKMAKIGDWYKNVITGEVKWSDGMYNMHEIDKDVNYDLDNLYLMNIHYEDRHKHEQYLQDLFKNKESYGEYRIVVKGKIKYTIVKAKASTDKEGNVIMYYGIQQDISELKTKTIDYQRMFDNSIVGMWRLEKIDKEWCISKINKRFLELIDRSNESELIGMTIQKLCDGRIKPNDLNYLFAEIFKTKHIENFSLNDIKTRKNSIKSFNISAKYYENENTIEGILIDVTERVDVSRKLSDSEARYNRVLTNAPIGILSCDNNGNIEYANEMAYEQLNIDINNKNLFNLEELIACGLINKMKVSIGNIEKLTFECHYSSMNKNSYLRFVISPYSKDNNNIGIICLILDYTVRKKMETQLEMERTLIRNLIETIPDQIYIKDISSRFTLINKAQADCIGVKDTYSAIGTWDFDYFDHANEAYLDEQNIVKTGIPIIDKEEYITTKNKGKRWVISTKAPLRNDNNEVTGIVGISHDITDIKNIQNKLKESNEILENFAYTTSHDLKTPLRGIYSFLDKMFSRIDILCPDIIKKDIKLRTYYEFVTKSVRQMNSIITDTLDYASINKNLTDLNDYYLLDCINDSLDYLKSMLLDINVKINIEESFILRCDRSQIINLFSNLISNAIKFNNKTDKFIEIGYNKNENYIYVKDNGEGIEEQHYDKVFNLFQRLHGYNIEGNGLGLAIVKRIVQKHNWDIKIESQVNIGTTFKIYLDNK